ACYRVVGLSLRDAERQHALGRDYRVSVARLRDQRATAEIALARDHRRRERDGRAAGLTRDFERTFGERAHPVRVHAQIVFVRALFDGAARRSDLLLSAAVRAGETAALWRELQVSAAAWAAEAPNLLGRDRMRVRRRRALR